MQIRAGSSRDSEQGFSVAQLAQQIVIRIATLRSQGPVADSMGAAISDIFARTIIDSRGNPTVEVDCYVDGVLKGRAAVPSGASTGSHEAVELRDGETQWMGKGVQEAVDNVNGPIRESLIGIDPAEQKRIDYLLIELDGSENKGKLGANAILGASLACLRAASDGELWKLSLIHI